MENEEKSFEEIMSSLSPEEIEGYKAKFPKTFEVLAKQGMPDEMIIMGIKSHEDMDYDALMGELLGVVSLLAELKASLAMGALGMIMKAVNEAADEMAGEAPSKKRNEA